MKERDAELRALVGYGVKRANSALVGGVAQLLGRFDLRRTTFSALSVIANNAGIRQSDLAEVLAIERPNLVQILDEVQRAGWIARARDGADRRVYRLTVTAAGLARLTEAGDALRTYDARLTRGMSAQERTALIAALRRVEENGLHALDEEAWEGPDVGEISTT
ncbi:MarR family transcriptional regulator [Rhodobacteraceae bacterium N5(2021)]|uniref:MarR family transcriptional regulator n=1 Tax=Gymnodinialimonas phycosphaerae TaxID=2841589 RepID=A0A975YFI4_9RHOB|nr:MarR family transcriptional regulator [Gymnodinialimonas phycosphaerae]MBY4894745.1 MarR family transcriptional regulator [Gymnodinialimonas phycosphaerae]